MIFFRRYILETFLALEDNIEDKQQANLKLRKVNQDLYLGIRGHYFLCDYGTSISC